MNIKDMSIIEFLEMVKSKNPNWIDDCCNCVHFNGECKDFALQGKCRAYNKCKDVHLKDVKLNKEN